MTSVFIIGFITLLSLTLELTWPIKTAKHSKLTVTKTTTNTSIG